MQWACLQSSKRMNNISIERRKLINLNGNNNLSMFTIFEWILNYLVHWLSCIIAQMEVDWMKFKSQWHIRVIECSDFIRNYSEMNQYTKMAIGCENIFSLKFESVFENNHWKWDRPYGMMRHLSIHCPRQNCIALIDNKLNHVLVTGWKERKCRTAYYISKPHNISVEMAQRIRKTIKSMSVTKWPSPQSIMKKKKTYTHSHICTDTAK